MQTKGPYTVGTSVSLLKQVAEGDEIAFRQVFDLYKAPFYSAAYKMTRSVELSEDVVQEVFITLWNKREHIGNLENPEGYLFKILHNCILAQFRKMAVERRLKAHLVLEHDDDNNPVEALLLDKENREILENVISQMPAQQQLVYRLAKQEGLSREEIASKLGLSPNTVRNHLSAAVEFIRNYFAKGASALVWLAIWNSL